MSVREMKKLNAEAKYGQKGRCYLEAVRIRNRPAASKALGRNPKL
jgi:hypothetical protein